jgi:hypothetical protein
LRRFTATLPNRLLDAVLPLPEADWDADWCVRAPASAILGVARLCLRLPGAKRKRAGASGTAVFGLFHLGDQIKMLNVLSRFPAADYDIITNVETANAPPLFGFDVSRSFKYHGLLGVFERTGRSSQSVLLPHPSITLPSALCFARRMGGRVVAVSTSEYAYAAKGVKFISGDCTSWKSFYESFFRSALGCDIEHAKPQIRADLRYHAGQSSKLVVCHLSAAMGERSMPRASAAEVVKGLAAAGYDVILLGAASELENLQALSSEPRVHVMAGRPLAEVASAMSRARAFVGMDSSMMNLADAVGLPSVVMYTATKRDVTGPFYVPSVPITIAAPTFNKVAVLTGRYPKTSPDWSSVGERVVEALAALR